MALSSNEQYFLELTNWARLNPLAAAQRVGIDLNQGLAPGTISTQSLQVLAPNAMLERAAILHSQWMLSADVFSHTGANGSAPSDRMAAAGYTFPPGSIRSENLGWYGIYGGRLDLATAIDEHFESLFLSAGHRSATMNGALREIGIAQEQGGYRHSDGYVYDSSMLTCDFATSGPSYFLTGVVYADTDNDDFYSIGEGRSGVSFAVTGGARAQASTAGGWALAFAPVSQLAVTITPTTGAATQVLFTGVHQNIKLDVIDGSLLAVSATMALQGQGIANAMLLGNEALSLSGDARANVLTGNAGANVLTGGGGADTLIGGAGNDRYVIDRSDRITEVNGGGNDTVQIDLDRATGSDRTYTLGSYLENLSLLGTGGTAAVGNAGANRINGNAGANRLDGGADSDTLSGGDGADTLQGGTGADRLLGGAGNDLYWIDTQSDQVVETALGGRDTLNSTVSYRLDTAANVEDLTLLGTASIDAFGNALDNRLSGNSGSNRLAGGLGHDRLIGAGGADNFLFLSAPIAASSDVIVDFTPGVDRIGLEDTIFGRLGASAYASNTSGLAQTAATRIVYESDTGQLWFDADGSASAARVLLATLATGLAMTAAQFELV